MDEPALFRLKVYDERTLSFWYMPRDMPWRAFAKKWCTVQKVDPDSVNWHVDCRMPEVDPTEGCNFWIPIKPDDTIDSLGFDTCDLIRCTKKMKHVQPARPAAATASAAGSSRHQQPAEAATASAEQPAAAGSGGMPIAGRSNSQATARLPPVPGDGTTAAGAANPPQRSLRTPSPQPEAKRRHCAPQAWPPNEAQPSAAAAAWDAHWLAKKAQPSGAAAAQVACQSPFPAPEEPYLAWMPWDMIDPLDKRYLRCLLCDKWVQDDGSHCGSASDPQGSKEHIANLTKYTVGGDFWFYNVERVRDKWHPTAAAAASPSTPGPPPPPPPAPQASAAASSAKSNSRRRLEKDQHMQQFARSAPWHPYQQEDSGAEEDTLERYD